MNFFKRLKLLLTPAKQQHKTSKKSTTISLSTKEYTTKPLLTPTEDSFFQAIKLATPKNYTVYPQINLAAIIRRIDQHRFQNELYRNIDFAIFDAGYYPKLLIEINDDSHKQWDRIERDHKVREICKQAHIPIITFWTEYGINQEYIEKRIKEYCK